MKPWNPPPDEEATLAALETRLGHLHVRQRLGLERDYEARVHRRGTHRFPLDNWDSFRGLIRGSLRAVGLHRRGQRNALAIELRENEVPLAGLPLAFDGYTILHISDLHLDINGAITAAVQQRIQSLQYDLCVLTGDYRARTVGPVDQALSELGRLRPYLAGPVYGVLGNHDSIRMVPVMEAMGYQMLLNEWVRLDRGDEAIYLSGIDDAHSYQLQDFHRAAHAIPGNAVSILLSHTPEVYRHAAHAMFDLMLCGHTHGGQICLPGGVPVLTDADIPRGFARGAWRYHGLAGYTSAGAGASIVDVRLNCPPEVTLHRLRRPA
ncbi:metallophosphoesterase [Rhodopila globiformis]|uniref:Metallophosphoesterase n=1 Tax=Rhodopila globiformis TaxID=1071 RepID=A0A2S6N0B7_RHOGL|nr:metallophosphoesterase [Rhodopila globiformis]PPQ28052.1 metallophosphoesterase [Rhodopila globiformis]